MIKLFKFLKPYKLGVLSVFLFVFLQSMSQLYLPNLMAKIVDGGILKGDTSYILKVGGGMLLVTLLGSICTVLGAFLASKVAMAFGRDIRKGVFKRVESFSLNEIDKIGTSSLVNRTTNDINQVQQVVLLLLRMIVMAPMMCIGGIIMAVATDLKLSSIFLVSLPILALTIGIIGRLGFPLFNLNQKKLDRLNQVLRENLSGIRVIRAFNKMNYEKKRFKESNKSLTDVGIKVNKIMATLMPLMMLILNLTIAAIIWFSGIRIDEGSMQIGNMMAFIQYATQIMFALIMLSMMFVMVPRASASAVRINEVLDTISDIKDSENPIKDFSERGNIEFKNVTFSYKGAERPAIENVSFKSRKGETTAIIGGTGSGKSTLVNLIPRFYDITSGEILIDGVDISKIKQSDLRDKIALVPQKTVVFSGSIKDNIKYGKEDATDDEVIHAAKIAQAQDFIENMEDKYDSKLSQGGVNVSGGQKQRISIARALVKKPEIYIFDDSFSALDFKTDALIKEALKSETINSTVITVAQRITSVMDADRIIVLDNGKVAGIGKHRDLLQNCKVYKEIAASQLSEKEMI